MPRQLILISGYLTDDELAVMGEPPKLFVAAKEDAAGAAGATHIAEAAARSWNTLLLVPGAGRGPLILDSMGADALPRVCWRGSRSGGDKQCTEETVRRS